MRSSRRRRQRSIAAKIIRDFGRRRYRTLEIQYGILKAAPFAADVDVQVLHSSLEIASLLDDRGPLGHEALRDIGHERRGELAHDFGRRRRGGPVLDESSYLGL